MVHASSNLVRGFARFSAMALVAALVLVPTVLRARQRVELRDTIRLSIRLNWQSDAPRVIADVARDDARADTVVPSRLAQQPHPAHVAPRTHAFDEPVAQPLFDNSPDLLRGPPRSALV